MHIDEIAHIVNDVTPLGLAAGLAFIIYQLIAKKGRIRAISDNHLSDLPAMAATLERIEVTLQNVHAGIEYLKGKQS